MTIEERLVHPDGTVEIKKIRTCRDYFQYFMYFLRGLTVIMLALNIAAFCIVIKIGITARNLDGMEKAFIVMSNIGFCLIAVVLMIAEFQPIWFIQRIMFAYYWGARGGGQVWMGIQILNAVKTIGYAVAAETGGDGQALTTFCMVTGWMIISVGLLMILLSVFCVRSIAKLESDREVEAHVQAMGSGGGTVIVQKNITQLDSTIIQSPTQTSFEEKGKDLEAEQNLSKNLSVALGISYVVAKSRFGGKDGASVAEKHFIENQKQMKALGEKTTVTKVKIGPDAPDL
jgi:hypothetical protein